MLPEQTASFSSFRWAFGKLRCVNASVDMGNLPIARFALYRDERTHGEIRFSHADADTPPPYKSWCPMLYRAVDKSKPIGWFENAQIGMAPAPSRGL
jgi:hypothetical protein